MTLSVFLLIKYKVNMMKKLADVINERRVNSNSDDYVTISYRPSHKIAAMIEIMCEIYGKNKANLFYDEIRELLAEYLLTTKEHVQIVKKIAQDYEESDLARSSLGVLIEKGILSISVAVDEVYSNRLNEIMQGKDHE